jgi:YbbR domain-containing protein
MNFRGVYTRNLGLKLVSLVIASLFWLYVEIGRDGHARVSMPVAVSNLAPGLQLQGELPQRVEIDLSGSRIELMKLQKSDPRVVLDMSGVAAGVVTFKDLEKGVKIGHGIRITRVYPSTIEITVAQKAQ